MPDARALPGLRADRARRARRSEACARPSSRSASGRRSSSYCEGTIRARAREIRGAVPEAQVFYGSKAFPNVAVLRLLAEEGIGADVSTLGELAFARAAGLAGEQLVVHGNAKSDEELRAAARGGRDGRPRRRRRGRARGGGGRPARARPGHARRRGRHARGDPDGPSRLEVRPPARRMLYASSRTRSDAGSTSPGSTSTSARSSPTSPRTRRRSTCSPTSPRAAATSSAGPRRS